MHKSGLQALLRPENSILVLIEHQSAAGVARVILEDGGASGVALAWELQLPSYQGGKDAS